MSTRISVAILAAALAWAQDESRSVWDGVYTADQAKRGQTQYRQHCASCHGASLTGGEMSPALAGGEFLANWNGLTAGDLFERIRKTMPQNKPGKLTRGTNAEILAYLLAFNKFPESQTELSSNTEFLSLIHI